MTSFALQNEVGHELHLYGYHASTFAFLASAAIGIERKELWGEPHLFG